MIINILFLLKNIDGGTGTYLEGLLDIKNIDSDTFIKSKVLVLEKPKYRSVDIKNYEYFYTKHKLPSKYKLSVTIFERLFRELFWLKKHVLLFNPDIIISSDAHAILLSEILKLLKFAKYKSISIIHNNLMQVIKYKLAPNTQKLVKRLITYSLNKSNLVLTVSKDLSNDMYKYFNLKKLPKTLHGVLPTKITSRNNLHKDIKQKIILSIARFDPQKDHHTLIKAFKIVQKKNPDTKLWLVGQGPLMNNIRNLANKLKVINKIKFFGWVQNPTNILCIADIFVLSSNWEGFPLTILEAMSKGIPVIATDCQYGPSEMIQKNKYGILTPVGDYKSLAKKIIYLLNNPNKLKYYSKKSVERSKYYCKENIQSVYQEIIMSTIKM